MNRNEKIKAFYAKKHFEEKKKERNLDKAITLNNRRKISIKYRLWENAITRINIPKASSARAGIAGLWYTSIISKR
jgi:hypothetical protein